MDQRDKLRFAADSMLGTLAKWLRVMGYDALYFQRGEDVELERIALREGRTLLTRDGEIVKRGNCPSILIRSDQLPQQLREVIAELSLKWESKAFTRCLVCNLPLVQTEKEKVKNRVPPYVYHTQKRFMICPGCGRIYWPGTHWQRMTERLREIVGGGL